MIRTFAKLFLLIVCVNSNASGLGETVQVVGSQWRDDWRSETQFPESFAGNKPILDTNRPGIFEVYIKNNHLNKALRLEDIRIDGQPAVNLINGWKIVWYQLKPAVLQPGKYGCISIRFRNFPAAKEKIRFSFNDAINLDVPMNAPAQVADWRIESVGFNSGGKDMYIYFRRKPDVKVNSLTSVKLPGFKNYKLKWLASRFNSAGIAGAKITFSEKLNPGEYAFIEAVGDDGRNVFTLVRIDDGFVPIGTFDTNNVDIPSLVCAGMNTLVMHGEVPEDIIMQAQRLGLQIVTHLNLKAPTPAVKNKSNIWAYLIVDEPDMLDWDYYHKNPLKQKSTPWIRQVGFYAQKCVETYNECQDAEPLNAVGLNLDMTYKPHNWFIYGRIPDVMLHDNYPLMYGGSLEMPQKSQRDAFSAAAPNPTVHIYQNCHWKTDGIDRRMAAGELVRLMLYPLGEGAKGLIGWWNVTGKESEKRQYWSTDTYHDLWAAQAGIFYSLDLISPLIAIGCPEDVHLNSDNKKISGKFLWCGDDGAIMVLINTDYRSRKTGFTQNLQKKVIVNVPLEFCGGFQKAVKCDAGKFVELKTQKTSNSLNVEVGSVIDGAIVLLCNRVELPEILLSERDKRRTMRGKLLLDECQRIIMEKAEPSAIEFDLNMNRNKDAVYGTAITKNVYMASCANFPASKEPNKNNAFEWYSKSGVKSEFASLAWPVKTDKPGKYLFVAYSSFYGGEAFVELYGNDKGNLASLDAIKGLGIYEFNIETPGCYEIRFSQYPDNKMRERLGRVSQKAWFVSGIGKEELMLNCAKKDKP